MLSTETFTVNPFCSLPARVDASARGESAQPAELRSLANKPPPSSFPDRRWPKTVRPGFGTLPKLGRTSGARHGKGRRRQFPGDSGIGALSTETHCRPNSGSDPGEDCAMAAGFGKDRSRAKRSREAPIGADGWFRSRPVTLDSARSACGRAGPKADVQYELRAGPVSLGNSRGRCGSRATSRTCTEKGRRSSNLGLHRAGVLLRDRLGAGRTAPRWLLRVGLDPPARPGISDLPAGLLGGACRLRASAEVGTGMAHNPEESDTHAVRWGPESAAGQVCGFAWASHSRGGSVCRPNGAICCKIGVVDTAKRLKLRGREQPTPRRF